MGTDPGKPTFSSFLLNFIRLETAGGALLLLAAGLAMVAANTPLLPAYELLLETRLAVTVGGAGIDKPLLLWINDGLMAVFFFLIGLEVKREMLEGELSSPDRIALALLGAVLWVAVLKSGVHATLAGVLIAFCIPMRDRAGGSPLKHLERDLHGPVAFAVLPVFAFANAGVPLAGMGIGDLANPVTLGIALGLLVGNPVGILGLVRLAVLLHWASLPEGVTWAQLAGAAFACGIGFTMSLFIASLAFEQGHGAHLAADKLGILLGSLASAAVGGILLARALPRNWR